MICRLVYPCLYACMQYLCHLLIVNEINRLGVHEHSPKINYKLKAWRPLGVYVWPLNNRRTFPVVKRYCSQYNVKYSSSQFSKMWWEELFVGSNIQAHILLNFLTCIKALENIMKCVTESLNLNWCCWLQQSWIKYIYGTDITHDYVLKQVTKAGKI